MSDLYLFRRRIFAILTSSVAVASSISACGGSAQSDHDNRDENVGASNAGGSANRGGGPNKGGSGGTAGTGGLLGRGGSNPGGGCTTHERCRSLGELTSAGNGGMAGNGGKLSIGGSEGKAGASGEGGAAGTATAGSSGANNECPSSLQIGPGALGAFYTTTFKKRDGDQCCYEVQECYNAGRPFIVDGLSRQAEVALRRDWLAAREDQWQLPRDPELCARLAKAWLTDAQLEHASVAAFARFTLQLMQLGAPPELVAASQLASLDEIQHAKTCFAMAERYSGVAQGPGAFDVGCIETIGLVELVRTTVIEGCVGETIAALVAHEQARVAEIPEVRATIQRIAEDETRHAELAWHVVRWAIELGGDSVLDAATNAFRSALDAQLRAVTHSRDRSDVTLNSTAWREHGRLTQDHLASVVERAIEHVIQPCAEQLSSVLHADAQPVIGD